MKKVIKHFASYSLQSIYGGISVKRNRINFNWSVDDKEDDVIFLAEDCSGEYNEDGVQYIYGYEYNPNSTFKDRKLVRNYLKELPTSPEMMNDDVDEFIDNGILSIESYHRLSDFSAVITTTSSKSPSLTELMHGYFMEYCTNVHISFELLKRAYRDVDFDYSKGYQALIDAGWGNHEANQKMNEVKCRFDELKQTNQLFQMKRFVPRELRASFSNFLKFKTDSERKAYEALQGVDVLIYDDFLTSGATVKEIIRYLRSFNNKNRLTVFVLVKQ